MIKHKSLLLCLLTSLLCFSNGCSHIPFLGDNSASNGYSPDQQPEPQGLEIPPDLSAPQSKSDYAVPGAVPKPNANTHHHVIGQQLLPTFENVRLASAGTQRWLVVAAPAEQLWPIAHQFWLDRGFQLAVDDPSSGIIETTWLEQHPNLPVGGIRGFLAKTLKNTFSTGLMDKFRMRMERADEPNHTEIFISHQGMEEVYNSRQQDSTIWQPRPNDPEIEAKILKQLMLVLGTKKADQQPLQVAQEALSPPTPSVHIETLSTGQVVLVLHEDFSRSWRRIGLALERSGYIIDDRDRSKGLYYARRNIPPPAQDDSFFGKLAFWRDTDTAIPPEKMPTYRIQLSRHEQQSYLLILAQNGQPLSKETTTQLLKPLLVELH